MPRPVKVAVANGSELWCSQEVSGCSWYSQGNVFTTNFRLLPLGCYDVILGMEWLEYHSPMLIDWPRRRMQIEHEGFTVVLCYVRDSENITDISCTNLPPEIAKVLLEYEDVFAEPVGLPPKRDCDHHIPLMQGAQPVNIRAYRLKPELKTEVERQIAEMLKAGIIQKSSSPFSSPIILVKNKDGTWRICVDYR
uniref:Reverse transcriptase domain-containing protein n=1 Tax=Aegilops tauschii subsp. strangulata TaxID=200361 RepID=A0A453I6G9_AEGTS